jgi:hypothetical protein
MVKMVKGVTFDFKCRECDREFGSREALGQHVRDKHTEAAVEDGFVSAEQREVFEVDRSYLRTSHGVQRLSVLMTFDADTEKLYHRDLRVAAAYLLDIATRYEGAFLEEHWTGYETMEMRFGLYREETDEEYRDRLETEAAREAEQRSKIARERERANIDKAIAGLQQKRARL